MRQTPMDFALTMLGKGEVPDNATLQEYLRNGGQNLDPATTAWCAAFVNASLGQAGIKGTGKLNARSFLDWGTAVDEPRKGDLAIFSRGGPRSALGHVGFFNGYGIDGSVEVLGGNQGNSVSFGNYPKDRLLGFRRAPDFSSVPGPHSDTHPMAQEPTKTAPTLDFADPQVGGSLEKGLLSGLGSTLSGQSGGRTDNFSPSAPIPMPKISPVGHAVNREAPQTNLAALLAALTAPLAQTKRDEPAPGSLFG